MIFWPFGGLHWELNTSCMLIGSLLCGLIFAVFVTPAVAQYKSDPSNEHYRSVLLQVFCYLGAAVMFLLLGVVFAAVIAALMLAAMIYSLFAGINLLLHRPVTHIESSQN